MNDIMLDLETLSNKPNAMILCIGAVFFDPLTGNLRQSFYQYINFKNHEKYDCHIDPETVMWWLKQSDDARLCVRDGCINNGISLPDALHSFNDYIEAFADNTETVKIWGNGSDFDNVILANAYHATGITPPWKFYNNRCYRTLKNLVPDVKMQRIGTAHNAIDDAISQARHAMEILGKPRVDVTDYQKLTQQISEG